MDPYIEDNEVWPDFHHSLAEEIKGRLNEQIGPKYYAAVQVRTVIQEVGISAISPMYPDVGVLEKRKPMPGGTGVAVQPAATRYQAPIQRKTAVQTQFRLRAVQVFMTKTAELVTTIEILSPYNKQPGDGLREYRQKRQRILQSAVHLVEIDLLRGGQRPGPEVAYPPLDTDYVLLVNRTMEDEERVSDIWPVALNESLPVLPVPLLEPDLDVLLDLTAVVQAVYTRSGYDWRIDYTLPVPPPELRPGIADWVQSVHKAS
jgi:hypothetical protein